MQIFALLLDQISADIDFSFRPDICLLLDIEYVQPEWKWQIADSSSA